jgi:hypothetical protein
MFRYHVVSVGGGDVSFKLAVGIGSFLTEKSGRRLIGWQN